MDHRTEESASAPIGQQKPETASPLAGISPKTLTKYFEFLDRLRKSGVTNMYGASPYLATAFGLGREKSVSILSAWMNSFDDTPASARANNALQAANSAGQ